MGEGRGGQGARLRGAGKRGGITNALRGQLHLAKGPEAQRLRQLVLANLQVQLGVGEAGRYGSLHAKAGAGGEGGGVRGAAQGGAYSKAGAQDAARAAA